MMKRVIAAGIRARDAVFIQPHLHAAHRGHLRVVGSGRIIIAEDVALDHAVASRQQKRGHREKSVLDGNAEQRMRRCHAVVRGLHHGGGAHNVIRRLQPLRVAERGRLQDEVSLQ